MKTESVGAAVHIGRAGGREFQISGSANEVQTNGKKE